MKRKPPKPKTPKSPETLPMKKAKPAGKAHTPKAATPSPGWLAEMAVQIQRIHPPPENLDKGAPSNHFQQYGFHWHDFIAVRRARSFYRAAVYLLRIEADNDQYLAERVALRRKTFLEEVLPLLTREEKNAGRVSFTKGCKIITRQARPERAAEWFKRLWQTAETEHLDDPEKEGFSLDYLVTWRLIFSDEKKTLKKTLAAQSAKAARKSDRRPAR